MKAARIVGLAAGLAVMFLAGMVAGGRQGKEPEGNQFMLLMFTRKAPGGGQPTAQAIVHEYRDWARARQQEGRLVGADKLSSVTRVMTSRDGRMAIAETAAGDRTLGGYFTITARHMDEAVEIAKTHPHLKYGGEVEVRPIEVVR